MSNVFGAAAGYSGIVQYSSEFEDQITLRNHNCFRPRRLRQGEDRATHESIGISARERVTSDSRRRWPNCQTPA